MGHDAIDAMLLFYRIGEKEYQLSLKNIRELTMNSACNMAYDDEIFIPAGKQTEITLTGDLVEHIELALIKDEPKAEDWMQPRKDTKIITWEDILKGIDIKN